MGSSLTFLIRLVYSFFIFDLAIAHFISSVQSLCHDHERSALLHFKESLVINQTASSSLSAYPKVASWNPDEKDSDCCSWDGVKCNEDTGHVVELDLASSCLYGSIISTSSLFQLVHLQRLSLFDNNFNFSEIPSEILNFSRLTHLNLSKSCFSGQIPAELLELSSLEVLDLSFNNYDTFFLKLQKPGLANLAENLTNLKALNLINVNISSTVPHTLANLSSLRLLSLSGCGLQGEFPQEIFHLPNLEFLGLVYNRNLTGFLPQFQKSSSLEDLRISVTRFSGKIPDSIENLQSLSYLDIRECSFIGKIPSSFGNLTKLEYLYLSGNGFSNDLPTSIGNLASLNTLEISSFDFCGTLQTSLGNLTQLGSLTISGSNLVGEMPSVLMNLTQLTCLDLSQNQLTRPIPYWLMNLTQLTYLDLSQNQLTGPIPYWLMNLNKVSLLKLGFNQLSGHIPVEIRNLTQLQYLQFSSNQLEGSIPSSIFELRNLERLDLSFNNLSGTVDLNMFLLSFKSLGALALSSNKLSVLTRTTSTTNTPKFKIIGLRSCNLIGFPSFLHNQDELMSLDLSSNKIAGKIPEWLLSASANDLQYLNLSYNLLIGVEQNLPVLPWPLMNTLDLSFNKLQGPLPVPSVFIYSYLVSNNQLTGKIPKQRSCNLSEFPHFLYNQKQLTSLDLSSNKIAGKIPEWLLSASANDLQYLNLSYNLLIGVEQNLPVLPWPIMNTLDLRFNKLQGPLPIPSVSIYSYLVSNNQLTGKIPPWICSLNGLHALDLSYNKLSGMLPECLGNFSTELSVLKLQGNNFRGSIPQTFTKGTNLAMIDLSNNSLRGRIPKSLANCVKLKFVHLGNNQITDVFPSWLGTLPELEVLVLKSNNFHGEIKEPRTAFEFSKLRIIDLSHNRFGGNLPSKHFDCWNSMKYVNASNLTYMQDTLTPRGYPVFTYFGNFAYSLTMSNKGTELEYEKLSNLITAILLSNNSFVGEIPASIANLKGLRNLNLSSNKLEGQIPSSLSNLTVLESLDLSSNKLSGQIPQQLGELTALEAFDVSDNLLTGEIPPGKQFHTFGKSSFDGNPGLCGEPLSKKCDNSEASPPEEDPHSESVFAFGWRTVLIGYASGTIIGMILGHIFSKRKYEWLAETFRLQPKTNGRRGRVRRHRQRM